MSSKRRRLILVTGIPGTGKTFIGNYLQKHLGFYHLDIEEEKELRMDFFKNPESFLASKKGNFVATWGFSPDNLQTVQKVQSHGFFTIWFDGNREAALRSFNQRGDVSEEKFHNQIQNIERCQTVRKLKHIQINTFDDQGEFRSPKDIAEEILQSLDLTPRALI